MRERERWASDFFSSYALLPYHKVHWRKRHQGRHRCWGQVARPFPWRPCQRARRFPSMLSIQWYNSTVPPFPHRAVRWSCVRWILCALRSARNETINKSKREGSISPPSNQPSVWIFTQSFVVTRFPIQLWQISWITVCTPDLSPWHKRKTMWIREMWFLLAKAYLLPMSVWQKSNKGSMDIPTSLSVWMAQKEGVTYLHTTIRERGREDQQIVTRPIIRCQKSFTHTKELFRILCT